MATGTNVNPLSPFIEEQKCAEGVAHIFGVMLFTDQHPNIKKVLRDEDYWLAFHQLTGDRFSVFSVKPEVGTYQLPDFPPGVMGMMVPTWKEPKANKELLSVFEIKSTAKLPLLLLFTEIEGKWLKLELPIAEDSVDSSYKSIYEQLEFVTTALGQVKEENLTNPEGLFAALALHYDNRIKWSILRKGINLHRYFVGLLP